MVISGVLVPGMKVGGLAGLSAHSAFHWWSTHSATRMLLLSDERMSCYAATTNGCHDLRRRTFALDEQVSAEWSRCPGAMVRCARDSVAPLIRSSAGWMAARIGKLSAGVGRRHPVTIRKASLMGGLIRRVWALWHQKGAQYYSILLNGLGTGLLFSTLLVQHPTGASKPPQQRDAWCQFLAKWHKVPAIRERSVQRYSEVFGIGAEGQDFIVVVDF